MVCLPPDLVLGALEYIADLDVKAVIITSPDSVRLAGRAITSRKRSSIWRNAET